MSWQSDLRLFVGYELSYERWAEVGKEHPMGADIEWDSGYNAMNVEAFAERLGLKHNCQDDDGEYHVVGYCVNYNEKEDKYVAVTPFMVETGSKALEKTFSIADEVIEVLPVIFRY